MKIRIKRKTLEALGWVLFWILGAAPYIILIAQLGK